MGTMRPIRRSIWGLSMCDLIFITTRHSSSYSAVSHSYFSLRWVVWSYTHWSNIASNFGVWVLGIDCKNPMVEILWFVCKFSIVLLESSYTRFYWVHKTIFPPTTNLNQNLDRSKNLLHISLSSDYYMYLGKQNSSNWRKL
jgi:hypothetical protein